MPTHWSHSVVLLWLHIFGIYDTQEALWESHSFHPLSLVKGVLNWGWSITDVDYFLGNIFSLTTFEHWHSFLSLQTDWIQSKHVVWCELKCILTWHLKISILNQVWTSKALGRVKQTLVERLEKCDFCRSAFALWHSEGFWTTPLCVSLALVSYPSRTQLYWNAWSSPLWISGVKTRISYNSENRT